MEGLSFSQGTAYSCQTLAAIGAIACNPLGKRKLNKICKSIADDFEIQFCKYPDITIKIKKLDLTEWTDQIRNERERDFRERLERVKEIMPPEQFFWILPRFRPEYATGDKWVRILELAYAKLMIASDPSSYPELSAVSSEASSLDLYKHKSFHYDPAKVINDITNWPVTVLIANGGSYPELSKSFASENQKDPTTIKTIFSDLAEISRNPEAYAVVATSVGTPGDNYMFLDRGTIILPWHDYIIKYVDEKNQSICLLDPYNSRIGLLLEYSDFLEYFCAITKAMVID